jgi:hypothetical protein
MALSAGEDNVIILLGPGTNDDGGEPMATFDEPATRNILRGLSERYVQGVDRRDADTFVSVFHPDGVITVHDPGDSEEPTQIRGVERLAKIPKMLKGYSRTFHLLGQSTYEIGNGAATGEVYCVAHHLTRDHHGGTDYVMFIRYEDSYRQDGDGAWKIGERILRVDWTETRAANPPT